MNVPSPSASRARLGQELRAYREAAHLLIEHAARELECSMSKVSRLETGKGVPRTRDVRDLLDLYDVTDEAARKHLLELAIEGQADEWWSEYRDVVRGDLFADHLLRYVELEQEASGLRWFEPELVPGLFQAREYVEALARSFFPDRPERERQRFVEFRMRRQRVLRTPGRAYEVVLGEAALLRPVGRASVMRAQAESLHASLTGPLDHVDFRVLPFSSASPASMGGPFIVMRFAEGHRDCVYLESRENADYLDDEEKLDEYDRKFEQLAEDALDREASLARLAKAAEDWARDEPDDGRGSAGRSPDQVART